MTKRVIINWAAIVALPLVAVGAFVLLGGTVDQCLAPSPSCRTHDGVAPWVVVPAAVVWVLAAFDIARARRNS